MARDAQWVMLEKLFDAKLGPSGEDIREVKEFSCLAHQHVENKPDQLYRKHKFLGE